MHIMLFMTGVVWICWGAVVLRFAVGGIHEVYAAILLSAGVLFLGLAELIRCMRAMVPKPEPNVFREAVMRVSADEYEPRVIER